MPRPSDLAASHRFWIAHDTDARSICGSVRRPKMCASRWSDSATTRSSAHSRMPSTLSCRNSSARCPSAWAVSARSSLTSACMRARSGSSVIRMKRHGCIRPTLGAACAACSRRANTFSGTTAPVMKRRMSRRSEITR